MDLTTSYVMAFFEHCFLVWELFSVSHGEDWTFCIIQVCLIYLDVIDVLGYIQVFLFIYKFDKLFADEHDL